MLNPSLSRKEQTILEDRFYLAFVNGAFLSVLARGLNYGEAYLKIASSIISGRLPNAAAEEMANIVLGAIIISISLGIKYSEIKNQFHQSLQDIDSRHMYPRLAIRDAIKPDGPKKLQNVYDIKTSIDGILNRYTFYGKLATDKAYIDYVGYFLEYIFAASSIASMAVGATDAYKYIELVAALSLGMMNLYFYRLNRKSLGFLESIIISPIRYNTPTYLEESGHYLSQLNIKQQCLSALNTGVIGAVITLYWLSLFRSFNPTMSQTCGISTIAIGAIATLLASIEGFRHSTMQQLLPMMYTSKLRAIKDVLPETASRLPDESTYKTTSFLVKPRMNEWFYILSKAAWSIFVPFLVIEDPCLSPSSMADLNKYMYAAAMLIITFTLSVLAAIIELPRQRYLAQVEPYALAVSNEDINAARANPEFRAAFQHTIERTIAEQGPEENVSHATARANASGTGPTASLLLNP